MDFFRFNNVVSREPALAIVGIPAEPAHAYHVFNTNLTWKGGAWGWRDSGGHGHK